MVTSEGEKVIEVVILIAAVIWLIGAALWFIRYVRSAG